MVKVSSLDVKINDAKDDLHYNVIYIITDTNIVKRENIQTEGRNF